MTHQNLRLEKCWKLFGATLTVWSHLNCLRDFNADIRTYLILDTEACIKLVRRNERGRIFRLMIDIFNVFRLSGCMKNSCFIVDLYEQNVLKTK